MMVIQYSVYKIGKEYRLFFFPKEKRETTYRQIVEIGGKRIVNGDLPNVQPQIVSRIIKIVQRATFTGKLDPRDLEKIIKESQEQ